jgi:hypothetical protein
MRHGRACDKLRIIHAYILSLFLKETRFTSITVYAYMDKDYKMFISVIRVRPLLSRNTSLSRA